MPDRRQVGLYDNEMGAPMDEQRLRRLHAHQCRPGQGHQFAREQAVFVIHGRPHQWQGQQQRRLLECMTTIGLRLGIPSRICPPLLCIESILATGSFALVPMCGENSYAST